MFRSFIISFILLLTICYSLGCLPDLQNQLNVMQKQYEKVCKYLSFN